MRRTCRISGSGSDHRAPWLRVAGLVSGVGVAAYIILWVIVPYPDRGDAPASEVVRDGAEEIRDRAQKVAESISQPPNKLKGLPLM